MHHHPHQKIDYHAIIHDAWNSYNPKRFISSIEDLSVNVSTNKVFKVYFADNSYIMVKVSNFGTYENFKEDHDIINVMANNLEQPYDLFLSSSLIKDNQVYIHRYDDQYIEVWLVFYRAVRIKESLPKKLNAYQIEKLGSELAKFHKVCDSMTPVLPRTSKTLLKDVLALLRKLEKPDSDIKFKGNKKLIQEQCETFINNCNDLNYHQFTEIPVFVDWNIGNFSVREDCSFFSRWDYDWFRTSSRVLDFYSFSRVVSEIGDKTDFSYTANQLNESRFLLFLESYHNIFPLTEKEIYFMKEAYRFFILNYVIYKGSFFFTKKYAEKLQQEAFDMYLPSIDTQFNPELIIKHLNI
ncbi:MAG: hypothetical protein R6U95_01320 [Bacteroidales bacterium]